MITATRKVRLVRRPDRSRAMVAVAAGTDTAPTSRVPRIARLMALAIYFDRLIREGKVRDQSELARLAHVTQPRMTQIMNLDHLAPDIQEELLFLPRAPVGRVDLYKKTLRPLCAEHDWQRQRNSWLAMRSRCRFLAAQNRT